MNKKIITVEKYGYLKTPQFWVNTRVINADGGTRIGPFKSFRQVGQFLKQYGPEQSIIVKNYEGWDQNEKMIETVVTSYNFKLFRA